MNDANQGPPGSDPAAHQAEPHRVTRQRPAGLLRLLSRASPVARFGWWLVGIGVALGCAIVILLLVFALTAGHQNWSILVTGVLISAAGAAVGTLVGFLFGIPKALQDRTSAQETGELVIVSNSNLEQISDWLTKILVGVGLTQIGKVPGETRKLAGVLAAPMGGGAFGGTLGVCLAVVCFVAGLLLMYMWTRTRFLEILQRAAVHRRELAT